MKFSTYLEQIAGVSIYPVISLAVFFLFFSIVVYRIFRMNKEEIRHLENLPLQD
jgi:cytochrome c oxidase cbb3-type subunit III